MPFDSKVMTAVTAELRQRLNGGRISKIYQPQPHEIALLIYAGGQNHRLLLTAEARFSRLQLTQVEKKNPPAPPTFCMLLRKYIEGGRIVGIEQIGRDRICHLRIGTTDELGNPAEFVLVAEVMGKHSNIILINPHGRIVDAIHRVTEEVNRYRELLPGLLYVAPPPVAKLDPATLTAELLAAQATTPDAPAWQFLLDSVDGLGPALAKEAVFRAASSVDVPIDAVNLGALADAVRELDAVTSYEPTLLFDAQGRLKDFHVVPLRHWPGVARGGFESVSTCLDAFFGKREDEDRLGSLRGSLAKIVRDELGRVRRKHQAQQQSLQTAENAEAFRVYGELITANLWQIERGAEAAQVVDYYDPGGRDVTIPLDPALSPAENAQAYYRRYQKARSGRTNIIEQLAKSEGEQQYLDQVEATLKVAASLPELEEIRAELQSEGYIRDRKRRGEARKGDHRKTDVRKQGASAGTRDVKMAPPLSLRSTDGLEIWVGRNNRQNDYLTMKLSAPHDLWLHTKEIPGAHVILRSPPGADVPDSSLHEAAALAAWYSKGRESSAVPVDYTVRKHVRKPSGAKPGMVIYEHQKTLWVTPDPALHPILQRHLAEADEGTGV